MTLGGATRCGRSRSSAASRRQAADLIVLDRNLFEIDPVRFIDTKVVYTVFAAGSSTRQAGK